MPSSEFVPNDVWGSSAPVGTEEELTTPSGQTCRARKMSIEGMISAGILADADALTATVTKHVRKIKGGNKKADGQELNTSSLLKDTAAIQALIGMMDRALPHIVVSPAVRLHFTETTVGKTTVTKLVPVEEREEGIIYTDQVDFSDKMFLFDWAAGGLAAMLNFRG
ncbi:MAG: hypothetical protein ABW022_11075 [Actinoplanes sp.]